LLCGGPGFLGVAVDEEVEVPAGNLAEVFGGGRVIGGDGLLGGGFLGQPEPDETRVVLVAGGVVLDVHGPAGGFGAIGSGVELAGLAGPAAEEPFVFDDWEEAANGIAVGAGELRVERDIELECGGRGPQRASGWCIGRGGGGNSTRLDRKALKHSPGEDRVSGGAAALGRVRR